MIEKEGKNVEKQKDWFEDILLKVLEKSDIDINDSEHMEKLNTTISQIILEMPSEVIQLQQ